MEKKEIEKVRNLMNKSPKFRAEILGEKIKHVKESQKNIDKYYMNNHRDLDRFIIYLSGGLILISMGFYEKITQFSFNIFFVLSILLAVLTLIVQIIQYQKHIRNNIKSSRKVNDWLKDDMNLEFPELKDKTFLWFLTIPSLFIVLSIISLAIFMVLNI